MSNIELGLQYQRIMISFIQSKNLRYDTFLTRENRYKMAKLLFVLKSFRCGLSTIYSYAHLFNPSFQMRYWQQNKSFECY